MTLSLAVWQPSEAAKALVTVLLANARHAAMHEPYDANAIEPCKRILSISRQCVSFTNNEHLPIEKQVAPVATREALLQGIVSHEVEAGIRLAVIATEITEHVSRGADPLEYMIDPILTLLEKPRFSAMVVALLSEAIDRNTTYSVDLWRMTVPFFI